MTGRRNHSTLRRAVEPSQELVFITDASGVVQYVNSACQLLTGYDALDLVERNLGQIAAELAGCKPWETLRVRGLKDGIARGLTAIRCKDGRIVELDLAITVVLNPRTQAAMLACTGLAVAQEQELVSVQGSSHKRDTLGAFVTGIAHDFNNLLMVIGAYAEMGFASLGPEHAAQRYLREIQANVRRASDLTRRLLMFGRQPSGQQLVSINWIIEDTAGMLARIMEEDIQIRVSLGKNIGMVRADPGQLEEVLLNLAINARDAMPNGGELVIETQTVQLDNKFAEEHPGICAGEHVLLTVTDSGHGMRPNELARIFEPYYTTKSEGKGTGLGLTIVQSVVRQHGGFVSADSDPGVGTSFKIYLPVVARSGKKPSQSLRDETPAPRGHESLLIVEDDDALRQSVSEYLSSLGYRVSSARTGEDALRIVETLGDLALIVVDVVMPQMSGPEFARKAASHRPRARVVFMSGHSEDVAFRKALHKHDSFLQKPFSLKSLAGKIRQLLDQPLPARVAAAAAGR